MRVTAINEQAVRHLVGDIGRLSHATIDDRIDDPRWRTAIVALLWHACWVDPDTGMRVLCHLFPPIAVLQPDLARVLVDIANFFVPYCPADQAVVGGLDELVGSPFSRRRTSREDIRAATRGLAKAPMPVLEGAPR